MHRFTSFAARAVAFVAMVLWAGANTASGVHAYRVLHVVCSEHGELSDVQLTDGSDHGHAAKTATASAGAVAHPDHCAFAQLSIDRAPRAKAPGAALSEALVTSDPTVDPGIPRGPPLAYAPKTSPPAVG